ncbi:dihydroorotate dehydrogenase (quinone) [Bartonella henselae]|uniref:Dihydroorotate dehydrogenase (quinone) n=1 Tax=Bartonella henselae (strain ATCC 49882 / DSM 28221 / CCUG 30454 / Houston 1) TaxID=283166 RepID=PYRD_BARHE|nr:quinone-dependent dihydroorotate dehydrogenase [Bartonella henselae]Q6G4F7.1 RecName: Full=Dihydroorotate dehydrogenase (quinone); AltName: Full=DHOdehase; Short=DHOD; Short=DHODase; AltName: Full=Dihydroorotate oxidase [Bartonella henselae str. Houston-1]ATP12003.1 dihydroorotate dehydrogenase (quinone) [Bartonella henselae]ETS10055.1 dihydroorotate dehydrogenase [Bartonella henselae JK 50]ETS10565.1 dihydroorotate dehydrogenase [Bartonella henselae JK 51]MDM9990556.1 quinone-dependent dih
MSFFRCIGRSALFMLDPEHAHRLAIMGLKSGLNSYQKVVDNRLCVTIAGLKFENFIGLAAGFDKNAEVVNDVFHLGFGFTEIGTVTPRPQVGNPKPRLFRLRKDEAIINRMGFNNDGRQIVYGRLHGYKRLGIVGINIGANKDTVDKIDDYITSIAYFYDVADYFTVNISSPNTPGLRDLQVRDSLHLLMNAISQARNEQKKKHGFFVPIFLKIAPDLSEKELDDVAEEMKLSDFDGLIVSNTTLSRQGLRECTLRNEEGGLSGRPLFERSTIVLAKMRQKLGKKIAIIGVGGIRDAKTALEKVKAGADLVQLYSGMVYEGPDLAITILKEILQFMQKDGVESIKAYRDQRVEYWAKHMLSS